MYVFILLLKTMCIYTLINYLDLSILIYVDWVRSFQLLGLHWHTKKSQFYIYCLLRELWVTFSLFIYYQCVIKSFVPVPLHPCIWVSLAKKKKKKKKTFKLMDYKVIFYSYLPDIFKWISKLCNLFISASDI